ncbi:unnamed protein product [Didymodactylos carnosus]|uniref:Uncharacterized protein n=1 Tax=Didymodactylos carnosus TaxID=1234261 RepID=A0A8S2DG93_9BILA|nr:unnamed protein product [Didymodactylos carnosus]CAF3671505.1 unnamed protein product [Didymodactylos carnosus]
MFSLRTTTATDMANVIVNEVICRYGCPKFILLGRDLRIPMDVILGVHTTGSPKLPALGLSTTNTIQIGLLNQAVGGINTELKLIAEQLKSGSARLTHMEQGQARLGAELKKTEEMYNKTVTIVSELPTDYKYLNDKINYVKQETDHRIDKLERRMEGMFLYTVMNNILHNQFSLGFLAPEDITLAIQDVIQRENPTFGPAARQLALSVYVTQLIIQQHVEFVPAVFYLRDPDEGSVIFLYLN